MTFRSRGSEGVVGAVCVVRDAVDIGAITIGHYLRLGFDRIVVTDDGSTDGTFEVLRAMAANEPRLRVARAQESVFRSSFNFFRESSASYGFDN